MGLTREGLPTLLAVSRELEEPMPWPIHAGMLTA